MKILVLTDHSGHSAENALYDILRKMAVHPDCSQVDVASRALPENDGFFQHHQQDQLFVTTVDLTFSFSANGDSLREGLHPVVPQEYDGIFLRLPPPLSRDFLDFLKIAFTNTTIINAPDGIFQTGSKEFLVNFPAVTPDMSICKSLADVEAMLVKGPIVLKPFRDYGGKGIIKIDAQKRVWDGRTEKDWNWFTTTYGHQELNYLAVEYLHNVGQGDKRIVVVDGEILGASLRLPAEDSWLCNVAAGGTSTPSAADEDERAIVEHINPVLKDLGIVMYGVDTLVGNGDRRILSEINTTSIGGLPQIARMNNQPLVERAVDLLLKRFSRQ